VLEPVSFHDRYQQQHTDARTPLDRLVDAVVADPPSRFQISQMVNAAISGSSDASADQQRLQLLFQSWLAAGDRVSIATDTTLSMRMAASPRMSDAAPRARQLAELGQTGLEALQYLTSKSAPSGWKGQQTALITEAAKPVAITNFSFLPSLQKLVDAAGGGD
jgi:hexosaminidase